jgi:hypothetical protein
MGFRNIFRALLAMLAVSAVCSAQAINETGIDLITNNTMMNIAQGGDPSSSVIYLLFALDIAILIIYTMYGYVTQNEKELMNAKGEFGQLLVSIAVIVLAYFFFIGASQIFLSQFNQATGSSATSMNEYNSKTFDAFRLSAEKTMGTAYNTIVSYRADASVPTMLPTIYTNPVTIVACGLMSWGYIPQPVWNVGGFLDSMIQCAFSFQTLTIMQDAFKGTYADVLDMEMGSIMSPLFNLMVFMILLGKFFINDALVYMFFGGVILRMTPWTRKAGDLIILVSLVAYIFFPFLYAVFLAAAQSVNVEADICSRLGNDADLPPFNDCSGPTGIMTLGKYAVLSSFVSSVILGLSLSILNNFRKVFEMVE